MTRTLHLRVGRPAAECYERFCEAERLPEWVPGLVAAAILSRDPAGRPAEVRFDTKSALGEPLSYVLAYAYDEARHRVAWYPRDEESSAVRGFVSFTDVPQGCRMDYALELGPEHAQDRDQMLASAARTCEAFANWLEG